MVRNSEGTAASLECGLFYGVTKNNGGQEETNKQTQPRLLKFKEPCKAMLLKSTRTDDSHRAVGTPNCLHGSCKGPVPGCPLASTLLSVWQGHQATVKASLGFPKPLQPASHLLSGKLHGPQKAAMSQK